MGERAWFPCLVLSMKPEALGHPEGCSKTDEGKEILKGLRTRFVTETLRKSCERLTQILETNQSKEDQNKFLVTGDSPTIVDCIAVPFLRNFTRGHVDYVDASCLNEYPLIVQYIKSFCAIDSIQGRYN